MLDDASNSPSNPHRHRYPVTDSETQGLYVVVSNSPKNRAEIEQIVASVIRDQGRVRTHKVRMIII